MFFNSFQKKIILVLLFICFCNLSIGQKSVRDSILKEIHKIELQINDEQKDTTYINLLNVLGNELRYYKTDSLLLLSTQALEYSEKINYKKGESLALLRMGDYYTDKGLHLRAISLYKKALIITKEEKDHILTLRLTNNLSAGYGYMGEYKEALKGYLQGIHLANSLNNYDMLSIMNQNIGDLYVAQKDYNQALDFYKKVKQYNDKIGNDVFSAETMSSVASLYADLGNLKYAMFNINKSITIFEKNRIMNWLAYSYQIKGKIYVKKKDYKWALHWYHQSERLHENIEDERDKIFLFNGMAKAYFGLKKDSISEKYAFEAFKISSKIKFKEGKKVCAEILYKLSKNKKDFSQALKYHELYQEISQTLTRDENKNGLLLLKTKIEHEKQQELLILNNQQALAAQKKYVYIAVLILFVFIVVTILVRRGEKIQKKLNQKLESKKDILEKREEELKELNTTKDKLFSIIGHDLRGPIGALQGLIKLFKEGEIGKAEFLEFIPKLQDDVAHILFTLNNLLSWGQTQMNGAKTTPTSLVLNKLVMENINLLSEIAEEKSIKLTNKIPVGTLTWSDKNQIDIVIRNLISNALKFTPNGGNISISAREKNEFWEISVQDTGVGMAETTLNKLFHHETNITTYGTNNEKGTGLGLSLCKEMVENNNGIIRAESILNKGSRFYFTLLKAEKIRRLAS
ncbi:MAG: tetratricopeptide repeat-containing sensor histidine kinase [Cellulophaga sp.]